MSVITIIQWCRSLTLFQNLKYVVKLYLTQSIFECKSVTFLFIFQTQKHSKVLQDFYKKLQESGKAKLLALHRSSLREPNLDYVRLLAELGQEQGFEITYVDIEERSASGENQCLVQLSTLPVAVCYGVGQNQATANNDAARHALNYLKLMTKKSTQNPDQQQMANKAKSKATNGK